MNALSPTMADAYRLLRTELYGHLDEAEFLALKHEEWEEEDITKARALISDLVTVIRGVVAQHKETVSGQCPVCETPAPCSAVETIHDLVVDPEHEFSKLIREANSHD
jgi:hypothetical protein